MTTLHVQVFGAGRPLLALHGIYGHGARFRALAAGHLSGFAVHALDLRGHGHSRWLPPWGLAQQVDDVLATMDSLGIGEADLLGFSYGGLVAVHLARQARQRVRRLVLMDPAIGIEASASQRGAANAMVALSFADQQEALRWRAESWPPSAAAAAEQEVADHLILGDDGRFRWRCEPASVVVAYSEMARPAVLPPDDLATLLLIGAKAGVVRPEYATACRDAGVDVLELDSGHQLMLERPHETGTAVRDFLTRLE